MKVNKYLSRMEPIVKHPRRHHIILTRWALLFFCSFLFVNRTQAQPGNDQSAQRIAKRVTIVRDNWGVPHIYGKKDADCSFGLMYAQCEDNFWQLEETMIRQLGRIAEVNGAADLGRDAEVHLFQCTQRAQESFEKAPAYIRENCIAAAAGINYFLSTHPETNVQLLHHFEPWFFLLPVPVSPNDHGITNSERQAVLGSAAISSPGSEGDEWLQAQMDGSNTLAINNAKVNNAKSILVINPHVGFFGGDQRYECHLISKEGLNASGFAILGTFYIWSGFNANLGWSHTNTGADMQDVYLETTDPADSTHYLYDSKSRPFTSWTDTLHYKNENGGEDIRVYQFRKTHHGPVVALRGSQYVTAKSVLDDDAALYILQSMQMAKAKDLEQFQAAMANCALGTNTMYADNKGNIAYWHGNRIAIRDTSYNWKRPVDGSTSKTEWKGYHTANQTIHYLNPPSGFLQNCNSSPFLASGDSLLLTAASYPKYMGADEQTLRSQEMLYQMRLRGAMDTAAVREAITSHNLPEMRNWLSQILADCDAAIASDSSSRRIIGPVMDTLRNWNRQYSLTSRAMTIAFAWHSQFISWARSGAFRRSGNRVDGNGLQLPTPPGVAAQLMASAVNDLLDNFGTVFVPWGDVCRLQRIHTSGKEKFSDARPSLPVNAAPSMMGSLFAFNLRFDPGNKSGYGVSGNTYVAIVSFGKKMNAHSIVTFGQRANAASPHYFDQAPIYAEGRFKNAWFSRRAVKQHTEARYHPGERP